MIDVLNMKMRVILALVYREIKTRFGRSKLGIFWLFFELLGVLTLLMVIWSVVGHLGPMGIAPAPFLITGILPFICFRNIVFRLLHAVDGNRALLVFPQISIMDLIIARVVIEVVLYFSSFALIYAGFAMFGIPMGMKDFTGFVLASFVLCFSGMALGMFLIPINTLYPATEHILVIVFRALYYISGVFFSLHLVPYEYQDYLLYNPVFHLIGLVRSSIFVEIPYDPQAMNYQYIFFVFGTLFVIGYATIQRYRLELLHEH